MVGYAKKWRTQSSDDLSLHAELTLEAPGNVRDVATTILSDIGHVANLVEHVAGREEEDHANDKETPNRTVAEEHVEVGPEGVNGGADTKDADDGHNHLDPVCRSREFGMRTARSLANNPLS